MWPVNEGVPVCKKMCREECKMAVWEWASHQLDEEVRGCIDVRNEGVELGLWFRQNRRVVLQRPTPGSTSSHRTTEPTHASHTYVAHVHI